MDKRRRFLFVGGMLLAASMVTLANSAHAQGNTIRVSSVKLIAAECESEDEKENELAPVVAGVVNSVIGAGVTFLADWFLKLEEKKKGHDVATGHQTLFDCIDNNDTAGYLVYARGRAGSSDEKKGTTNQALNTAATAPEIAKSFSFTDDPEMLFVGRILAQQSVVRGEGQPVMKIWVEPMHLWFDQAIASRGSTKDISVTIAFDITTASQEKPGGEIVSNWKVLDPLLFRSVAKGTRVDLSDTGVSTGAILIHKLPYEMHTSVRVTVDEVPEGGGNQLLALIYQAIGESLKEQKQAISSGITDALLARQPESTPKN